MTDLVGGIAIVGMAGRFPGAADVDTFWSNLCAGVESVVPFCETDLAAADADRDDPAFVNAGAQMEGIEEFDADFFGMGRREAEMTDPQHRLVLQTVWTALEHAGCDPGTFDGRIGLFGGVARNLYLRHNLEAHPDLLALMGDYPTMLATEREYAITRAAYKLGLTGPAVSINTACSTSGVATHLAVQSLLAGDSDLALAGGACIVLPMNAGYFYQEGNIFSASGHVRAFDAGADGTVLASGAAFIALKRLDEAVELGDTIYAVIRGSAINNDGAGKVGFTAPSIEGQAAAIGDALAVADVNADRIGMLEAHGTGTLLGDPVEVEALTRAYRRHTDRRAYCAIGSLKSNVGHLDAAAGAAGIIKAALALYHERIPPSINYRSPNPHIDFASSPFFVNTELREWRRSHEPRRAGISAFGLGGTNAHVVLEEAPVPRPLPPPAEGRPYVLAYSANGPQALEERRRLLAEHLAAHPEAALADVSYALGTGRSRMPDREAVVADDVDAAVESLLRPTSETTAARTSTAGGTDVAFLFTGTGAQYVGMGAGLYRTEPVFADAMRQCADAMRRVDGHDLIDLLYGAHADGEAATRVILRTAVGQPATFALQYSLSQLWASWGVRPTVMVGHSVGELAAACVGGLFTLEDAMRLTTERGRLIQDLPRGAMTAILAEEAAILPLLDDALSLAAANAPEQCVVSGTPDAIETLEQRLAASELMFRRLPIDVAGHSAMMEPVLEQLRVHVEQTTRGELLIPMISTLTGALTSTAEMADPPYWARHARHTVRFADAIGVLSDHHPGAVLIEIGPGSTLISLARQHPALARECAAIATLPSRTLEVDDRTFAYRALADAWTAGVDVDWAAVNGGPRRRIALPTYPFARERYWIEPDAQDGFSTGISTAPRERTSKRADVTAKAHPAAADAATTEGTDARISALLADLSGLEEATLDPTVSFTDLGFDSLLLAQFNSRSRKMFGVRMPLEQLLSGTSTIDTLAAHIDHELELARLASGAAGEVPEEAAPSEPQLTTDGPTGTDEPTPIPLLPNLARYLGERHTPHPEQWNVSGLLAVSERLDSARTRRVVAAMVERHDALRLRVSADADGYITIIAPPDDRVPFAVTDLTDHAPEEQTDALERRADELQASLDLEHGPLIRVELFELGEQEQRLLVIVHHFVFDQLSWRPFWEDFIELYKELGHGQQVTTPLPETSYRCWAQALQRYADSEALQRETSLWRDLPWERVRSIPLDHPDGVNTNASADDVEVILTPEETGALLRRTPGVVRKVDLVLTALAHTVAAWTGSDTALIDMMGHGRDDSIAEGIDPMDSVGFFISYTPLVLRLPASGAQPRSASLTGQIEPLLRHGLSFDLLRYMTADAGTRREFGQLPRAEVMFNHQGRLDQPDELPRGSLFCAAPESSGQTHAPDGLRYYPIAVSSKIQRGRLRLAFVYSASLHERSTIEGLAHELRRQLAMVVADAVR